MAIALTVFKIENIKKTPFLNPDKKIITLEDFEQKLDQYTDINGNPAPSTNLKRIWYDSNQDRAKYKVEHWTDTNREIVRVFIDDLQDAVLYDKYKVIPNKTYRCNFGYQLKIDFEIILDLKSSEIFIFTNRRFAKQFINRLKGVGAIEYSSIKFNLKEITKDANVQNVSTVWEDEAETNIKKIGYIGIQVHKDKRIDLGKATAIRVEMLNNDKLLPDVFISEDCRLSSLSKHVTGNDLIEVYKDLKKKLMVVGKN